ncbi:FecR family protein [Aquimarina algicola]|uniref:FecR family protein n=1 Tax=Aquimarina algicola TaxID=2589995 RepID=A0A504J2X2_9FLAO|nr:FecR domain-containing protein [Aquimarina algicola]TPN82772.1 FecR family protein [Aquimarina algicola]
METLILKYITNTISKKELDALKKWLQKTENQEYFKTFIQTNYELDVNYSSIDSKKAYNSMMNVIESKTIEPKPVKRLYYTYLKYAAVILLLIISSIGAYTILTSDPNPSPTNNAITQQIILELEDGTVHLLDENDSTTITSANDNTIINQEYDKLLYTKQTSKTGSKLAFNKLIVPYGKRFKIELSDGTLVFLNAGTTLRYPRAFTNSKSRKVYLEGEAYFDVKENKNKPFIVQTNEMNVRVLGTKFNVSSYQNEYNTSAVLVEGSIAAYKPSEDFNLKNTLVVKPGEQAMVKDDLFTIQQVNTNKHIAWTEGKLYFVNDKFQNIIKELERHYAVTIKNTNQELNDIRYTGTFLYETIEQVLNTFKHNTQFEYTIKGKEIIIKSPST